MPVVSHMQLIPYPMPRPRKDNTAIRPAWATALMARRMQLGLSQEAVAGRTGDALAQRTVSHLENGKIYPTELTMARVAALSRALNWTLYEMQDALGIDLGIGRNPASTLQTVASHAVPAYPMLAALDASVPPLDFAVMLSPPPFGSNHPRNLRAFVMHTDEMTVAGQRSIHPGDYVITDLGDAALVTGGLYVITRAGQAHVRRYKETELGNGYYADNISYDPLPTNGTHIVGRVYRLSSADRAPTLN